MQRGDTVYPFATDRRDRQREAGQYDEVVSRLFTLLSVLLVPHPLQSRIISELREEATMFIVMTGAGSH